MATSFSSGGSRSTRREPWASNWQTWSLAAASQVHPFLYVTKRMDGRVDSITKCITTKTPIFHLFAKVQDKILSVIYTFFIRSTDWLWLVSVTLPIGCYSYSLLQTYLLDAEFVLAFSRAVASSSFSFCKVFISKFISLMAVYQLNINM